jgi:uncharacterized membrane protein HdeD (DUF308 family)
MKQKIAIGIIFFRGSLATILGLVLLFNPDKTLPMLANFMGGFWMVSGLMSLRWGASGERAHGWAILAGIVGIIAGIVMIGSQFVDRWISEEIMLSILGVIILLTGMLHAFGSFRVGEGEYRKWSTTSVILGIFEIVLGGLLIAEPLGRSDFFYMIASIWALVGGLILIGDALRLRKASVKKRSNAFPEHRSGAPGLVKPREPQDSSDISDKY